METAERIDLTLGFVRQALAGKAKVIAANFDAGKVLREVSTDSRTIEAGDLFVALKGENFDGHEFIASAIDKGCRAFICEKFPAGSTQEGVTIFLVEDSLKAFRQLSKHWREHLNPTVIAVAGSVGKTTTKDLLTAILKSRDPDKVLATKGSFNGFIGIPITLMQLRSGHEFAVIEVGIDAPGAMIQHIDVVRPDFAVVTAISEEHLEWLKDLKTIAHEENLILRETAQAGGVAVINLDDPWIAPLRSEIQSQTKIGFTLGEGSSADILAGSLLGDQLSLKGLGHAGFLLQAPLPGKHNARNLVAAASIALALGFKPHEVEKGLGELVLSGGRSELHTAANGATVFCDFYNANPSSMQAAFEVAKERANPNGRIMLCLADMKELGEAEESLHRGLAGSIKALGPTVEIRLTGDRMLWLKDELDKLGFKNRVRHFSNLELLSEDLSRELLANDFLVIKGSNSMKLGRVWDRLKC